jgi:hypothetical protein
MYEPEEDFGHEEEESDEIQNELWQEACWIVISAYFEEKGMPASDFKQLGIVKLNGGFFATYLRQLAISSSQVF